VAEPLPSVVVTGEGARLVREKGVAMVYSKWVKPLAQRPRLGQLVVVEDEEGELLGCALYDTVGPVALRLIELHRCSYGSPEEAIRSLLERAYMARRRLGLTRGPAPGYRLVHSDGDMLPGLIVDYYAGLIVYQSSSAVWDHHRNTLVEALVELLEPSHVYEKSTQRTRRDIGLEPVEALRYGRGDPTAVIEEEGVRFLVDPRRGQKTGFFLDQRLNRARFGRLAQGSVLDLFAYTGGFGIHALVNGTARKAVFVEEDSRALELLRENLRLNNVEGRARLVEANVWSFLRRAVARRERYDAVAVDPPAFIPHPGAKERGVKAYRRLFRDSLRLAASGANLVLSSCSTHLGRDEFRTIVAEAAAEARRNYTPLGGVEGMPPDHPVRPSSPHLEYLKAQHLIAW